MYKRQNDNITIINERSKTLSAEVEQIKTEITTTQESLNKVKAEYETVKATLYYKKYPTAFLTFDDGPSQSTAAILDILNQNNIKATFYCNARQLDGTTMYDDVLKRIVNEGHILAVHSYSHDYELIYSSKKAFFDDLDTALKILETKSGAKINLIRLPSGTASAKMFCKKYGGSEEVFSEIMEELEKRGIHVADWNIDTNDWSPKTTSESISANVKKDAQRRLNSTYKTAIVLMHNKDKSVAALPGVITTLKDSGFQFEPMKPGGYTYIQKTR